MADGRTAAQKILSATRARRILSGTAATFENPTAAILSQGAGDFVCTLASDSRTTTMSLIAGVVYPLAVKSIDSGTAVEVVALFNSQE